MPYDPNDPRSGLTSPTGASSPRVTAADAAAPPEHFELSTLAPDEVTPLGSRSWIVRSQTCCVVYSMASLGDTFFRVAQPDEHVVLLVSTPTQPAARVTVTAGDGRASVTDDAVVVVPPGDSTIEVTSAGVMVRVFSNEAADLLALARNAGAYVARHSHVAPFATWPAAPDGDQLRVYRLADTPPDP